MEQKTMKNFIKEKYIVGLLIALAIIIIGFLSVKVYADVTINGGTPKEIADERTILRMSSAISRGENANNKVNSTTLASKINGILGNGSINFTETADTLTVTFLDTGNIYEINKNTGAIIENGEYIITFNANGGTGGPGTQSAIMGEEILLSRAIPVRTGYSFVGWATSADATEKQYDSGGSYTGSADATLYAVWQEANIYVITFNPNGGTGGPATQSATVDVQTILSAVEPTRDEYTFLGWATSADATEKQYDAGGSYTGNSDVTLYAVWGEIASATYTITLNTNGGAFSNGDTTRTQTKTAGESVTLPTTAASPQRDGYTFLGWSTDSNANSATYGAGTSYTVNSNVILYAVWEENTSATTYTLTYNANGGYFSTSSIIIRNVTNITSGTSYTIASTATYIPTRSGYTFKGWAISSSATTANYQPGDSITINSNRTLYAVWQSNTGGSGGSGYTITFNANGGTFSGGGTTMLVTDTTGTVPEVLPIKSGYSVDYWYTRQFATASGTKYKTGDSITLTTNITLYAIWKSNNSGGDSIAKLPITPVKVSLIPIKWTSIILGF